MLIKALLFTLLSISLELAAQASLIYSGVGFIEYTIHSHRDPKPLRQEFTVAVSNNCWLITLSFTDSNSPVARYECGTDGTNVYSMAVAGAIPLNNTNGVNVPKGPPANDVTASIKQGVEPGIDCGLLDTIWLAYASHHFFQTNSLQTIRQLTMCVVDITRDDQRLGANWTLSKSPFGLPTEVAFLSDGFRRVYEFDKKSPRLVPFDKPFDVGFVIARYNMDEPISLESAILPKRFSFVRFKPKKDARLPADLEIASTVHGVLTALERTSPVMGFIPDASKYRAYITDERVRAGFRGIPVSYLGTNLAKWKTPDEVKSSSEYRRISQTFGSKERPHFMVRAGVISLLLLSVVALIFITFKHITRKE